METYREKVLKEMREFVKDKRNSYDRHLQEDAYWTAQECISLVKNAESKQTVIFAKSIFDRYKWYL